MVRWSSLDRCYLIVVGNQVRYANTIGEAYDILSILEFGEKLKKLLK